MCEKTMYEVRENLEKEGKYKTPDIHLRTRLNETILRLFELVSSVLTAVY